MSLTLKTTLSSNIINFPYDSVVEDTIECFLKKTVKNFDKSDNNDWTVIFQITPSSTHWTEDNKKNLVGIYQKGLTYSKDKEKIFTLVVPIPNNSEIYWGLPKKNYMHRPLVNHEKYILKEVNFHDYESLNEYLIQCSIIGINALLNDGITVNKIKYKINN